jgi:thioredoxin reductase (NADPH)
MASNNQPTEFKKTELIIIGSGTYMLLIAAFTFSTNNIPTIIIEEFATEFRFQPGGPHQVKVGEEWYLTNAVILANGAAAKWLGLDNETKLRNNGISACATCDGPLPIFRQKEIYVIVSRNTRVSEIQILTFQI